MRIKTTTQTGQASAISRPRLNSSLGVPFNDALDIAIQTAQGLQTAHEKGVVHRDIKNANLMVTSRGQVKIMDA